jgi:hypothetical protein
VFVYFDNSHTEGPGKPKEKSGDEEMDSRGKGDRGKGKEDEADGDEDGWSDIESAEKKRGEQKSHGSLCQRVCNGRLLDGKKQVVFEPKFKEKSVKEILSLLQKEQEFEGYEVKDGRKYIDPSPPGSPLPAC